MKRYYTFIQIICLCLLTKIGSAQDATQETLAILNELNSVQLFADQKQVTDWSPVRRDIKLRDFNVAFDTTISRISGYHSDLVIKEARVTLVRYKKYLAFTFWHPGGVEPMNVFYTMAKPGDRYELELTLAAKRKTGEQIPLKNKFVYNLPLL